MSEWLITWWDGSQLRKTIAHGDLYNIFSSASAAGVNTWAIIKIERLAQP
jgi:hypothetical protein